MGRKGPAKKPTKLEALQGNPGRRPLNTKEPAPQGKAKKPYGLNQRDPFVAKLWDRYGPVLEEVGLLTEADELAFLNLLRNVQIGRLAYAYLKADGITRPDDKGVERKHPAFQVWRETDMAMYRWMSKFGMTPSDRAGLATINDKLPTLAEELFTLVNSTK